MNVNGLSLLFPDQDRVAYRMISEEAWHDLGMDAVTEKVAKQPQEIPLIQRVMTSLTDDPTVRLLMADAVTCSSSTSFRRAAKPLSR